MSTAGSGKLIAVLAGLAAIGAAPLTLAAQTQQPSGRDGSGCPPAAVAAPSTATESGPHSGTKNMGATGWSGGGLGGSHNDTVHKGPSDGSRTWQPPTASGLDPTKPTQRRC